LINTDMLQALQDTTDSDFVAELIDTYLDDCPALLDGMRQALAEGSADAFRRAAHSLKSNSATLGAEALAETARGLEMKGRDDQLDEIGAEVESVASDFAAVRDELEAYKHALKR
jgi:HPt (histidine-containing phosphotransfer) domain-containing protein